MNMLIIDGLPVEVRSDSPPTKNFRYARDEAVTVSNDLKTAETGPVKIEFSGITTAPLNHVQANDLANILLANKAVAVTGDMAVGTFRAMIESISYIADPNDPKGFRQVFTFALKQV